MISCSERAPNNYKSDIRALRIVIVSNISKKEPINFLQTFFIIIYCGITSYLLLQLFKTRINIEIEDKLDSYIKEHFKVQKFNQRNLKQDFKANLYNIQKYFSQLEKFRLNLMSQVESVEQCNSHVEQIKYSTQYQISRKRVQGVKQEQCQLINKIFRCFVYKFQTHQLEKRIKMISNVLIHFVKKLV
ncbi:unnamed protein product [Paramecium octaurelia]|uniref:Transmembrane protein n=1 Tax=Paramecium octaurelia TaxID=43137 RepID=A0A8S1XLI2_PAROT|nr:unnamed protein product [Paramecium octaurelia]